MIALGIHYLKLLAPTRVPIRYLLEAGRPCFEWPDSRSAGRTLSLDLVPRADGDTGPAGLVMIDAHGYHWMRRSERAVASNAPSGPPCMTTSRSHPTADAPVVALGVAAADD